MKDKLSELNVSSEVQNRLVEQMQAVYQILDCHLDLSVEVSLPDTWEEEQASSICHDIVQQVSSAFEKHLQTITNKLFIERLEREVDLYRA
jgi:hypothetical protein